MSPREIVEMVYAEWIAGRDHQGKPPVSRKHARLGIDDQGLMQHFQRCRAGHDDVRVEFACPADIERQVSKGYAVSLQHPDDHGLW